jgi:MFS family permease
MVPSVAIEKFGVKYSGTATGLLYSGGAFGYLCGAPVAGFLYDTLGSYLVASLVIAGLVFLGFILLFFVDKSTMTPPTQLSSEQLIEISPTIITPKPLNEPSDVVPLEENL